MNYDVKSIFEEIETSLIESMKRTLWNHKQDEDLKGFDWPQWQALKLKQLEDFKGANKDMFDNKTRDISPEIRKRLKTQFREGAAKTYKKAIVANYIKSEDLTFGGSFFGLNERKLKALLKSTSSDLKNVRTATLRMANDKYRQIIFKSQMFANTGAKTVKQAIDMATKDFLTQGFNCIEYKNGSRHNIADYADMNIRTANKRANLMGEGEMRKKIGNPLVYISKHSTSCSKCTPWQDRVYIDDVWSGGTEKDGYYPLISTAIAGGLFHPRCMHGAGTYFEGINEEPEKVTQAKQNINSDNEYTQVLQRQKKQYERLIAGSLYTDNINKYQNKVQELQNQIESSKIENKELDLMECEELMTSQGITFSKDDLVQVDPKLLSDNTKRINELIEKYPVLKDYIKTKNVKFNALNLEKQEMAHVSTNMDIKNIEISLSKKHFNKYENLIKIETKELEIKHCMDRLDKYKSTYTITHEFGHFIESKFIDDYNKVNVAEFLNTRTKILNANSKQQSLRILQNYQLKITDKIANDIYKIALKNNPKMKINELLSGYGKTNSFEFFAECFANLECGKPNELALALKQYLKERGV